MDRKTKCFKGMHFDCRTTTGHDYCKYYKGKHSNRTPDEIEKPIKKLSKRNEPVSTNWETLGAYRKDIPFTLYIKDNPILDKDPREIQRPYERQPDEDLERVIQTRPREVLPPQLSIDDMHDLNKRAVITRDMYRSTVWKDQQQTAAVAYPPDNLRAPLTGTLAPAKPVFLPKLQPPYVSPEWRKDSVSWDRRQPRSTFHPTKKFWKMRALDKST